MNTLFEKGKINDRFEVEKNIKPEALKKWCIEELNNLNLKEC